MPSDLWAGAGTTTADILKINQGARPAGMAGVYTAMGDDGYSVDYNPAGLAPMRASQVILLHLTSLADISYENLIFATPVGNDSTLASNFEYRYSPPINNQPGNPLVPPVSTDDLLGSLSYALQFSGGLRVGATFKYVKSDLASFSASAIAVDLGAQLESKLPWGLRVGLSIQNLGTGMSFTQAYSGSTATSASLPMFIRLGIGTHQVIDQKKDLNVGIEIFKPSDQDIKLAAGMEYWAFPDLFAVRGGYKLENFSVIGETFGATTVHTPNAFTDYTLGFTLTRRIDTDDFSLDVAYDPANFVSTTEATFFFALNFKFNQLRIF